MTIHHPSGDAKKISFDDDPTEIDSYGGTNRPGDGTHLRVVQWDLGSTEPGSTGAPLLSPAHRLLGQLHGGSAACGNNGSDYFGRFALSWTGGGTPGTRLSDWLDPGATEAMAVDTLGRANYRTFAYGCPGSLGVTHLVAPAPPSPGSSFQVGLDHLPSNVALMVTGFSNTLSNYGMLPVDLAFLGMPGCFGHVSPDLTVLVVGANHQATWSSVMPSGSNLLGTRFFQQAFVLDPLAGNAGGLVISEATTAVLGGLPGGVYGTGVPDMVPIPPGTFLMGSNAGPPDYSSPYYTNPNERPVHQVTISRPFCIGMYEVTQAEYRALMGGNPSYYQGASIPNNGKHPVESVSWNDAMAYCAALTARERTAGRLPAGYVYRLPTEAEWEYCCRAGTTAEFCYGNSLLCGQANFGYSFHTNSLCTPMGSEVVGSYAPNAWGLFDMHGNVWEWCLDCWDHTVNYPSSPVVDPCVRTGPLRILRGGSMSSNSNECRSAYRLGLYTSNLDRSYGFRVVLGPVLP